MFWGNQDIVRHILELEAPILMLAFSIMLLLFAILLSPQNNYPNIITSTHYQINIYWPLQLYKCIFNSGPVVRQVQRFKIFFYENSCKLATTSVSVQTSLNYSSYIHGSNILQLCALATACIRKYRFCSLRKRSCDMLMKFHLNVATFSAQIDWSDYK